MSANLNLDHVFEVLDRTSPCGAGKRSPHTHHSSTVNPHRESHEPSRSTLEAELLRVLAGLRKGNWPSKDEIDDIYADPYLVSVAHVVAMAAKRMLTRTGYELLKARRAGRKQAGLVSAMRSLIADVGRDSDAAPGERRIPRSRELSVKRCTDVGLAYAHSAYLLLNEFIEHEGRVGEAWPDVSISEILAFADQRGVFQDAASDAFEMHDELHPAYTDALMQKYDAQEAAENAEAPAE